MKTSLRNLGLTLMISYVLGLLILTIGWRLSPFSALIGLAVSVGFSMGAMVDGPTQKDGLVPVITYYFAIMFSLLVPSLTWSHIFGFDWLGPGYQVGELHLLVVILLGITGGILSVILGVKWDKYLAKQNRPTPT